MEKKGKENKIQVWGWENHVLEGKYRLFWTMVGFITSFDDGALLESSLVSLGFWPWCKREAGSNIRILGRDFKPI